MYRKPGGPSGGNGLAAKRIKKEIADLSKENLGAITLTPNESNILLWRATLPGPAGSPYEGGVFEVDIKVPDDYPFSPPHLHFITKVYHCNVAGTGAICLDLLKSAWSPALSLYKVILSLSSLLTDPNPADPLVPSIAAEYKKSRAKHDQTARDWVQMYALPKTPAITPAPVSVPVPAPSRTPTIATSRHRSTPRPPVPTSSRTTTTTTVSQPQVAGVRRSHASSAIDVDDNSDIEVLGDSSTTNNANGTNTASRRGDRAAKRARVGNGNGAEARRGGNSADDVIVIDE